MRLQLEERTWELSTLLLVTDAEGALRALEFADHEARMHRLLKSHYGQYSIEKSAAPATLVRALDAYFSGSIDALVDLPVATGGTAFQRLVWDELRKIPAGTTLSYGRLAERLGRRGAARAVGAANAANPVAIVLPCHRVIGASGTLTGYAGGLGHKQWLLAHERRFAGALAAA
jgi:methylated-DNA-[protein]-cysteine S-methyltransferase